MSFTPIFQSNEKNEELKEKGYAIVPFLTDKEVEELKSFFYEKHKELPEGMYATSHSPDFDLRKLMNEKIRGYLDRAANSILKDARVLGATYMVKSKGANSALHPHQDWSIVDESKYNSYNIWLPLVDTNSENGTLLILPDSHKLFDNTRGLNIPSSFEQVVDQVWKYLKPINMKAGEALIYDHRLLHASEENKTDIARLVIVSGLVPKSAEMRYYFGRDNQIEEYACTPEFYFNQDINNGPEGLELLKKEENRNPLISSEKLNSIYAEKPKGIIERILSFFS